jgi:hypothetical protein
MVRAEAYHTHAVHLEYLPIINLGVTFRRGRPPVLLLLLVSIAMKEAPD